MATIRVAGSDPIRDGIGDDITDAGERLECEAYEGNIYKDVLKMPEKAIDRTPKVTDCTGTWVNGASVVAVCQAQTRGGDLFLCAAQVRTETLEHARSGSCPIGRIPAGNNARSQQSRSEKLIRSQDEQHELRRSVTEKPRLNATEIWHFINITDDSHPMHIHLVQFLVLERARFDLPQYLSSKQLRITEIRATESDDQGWKDTVRADSGEILSLLVRFTGYTGRYVFHCHMLEHEDNETMRPFEVVA